jgi:2-polyprenyl-3-methyl-5-hydroxy-6-metoxy-1,4-benzoquinol methylase
MNQKNNTIQHLREMMFGNKTEFEYLECGYCGCLQLVEIPRNMDTYYPDSYYSFKGYRSSRDSYLKKSLKNKRADYFFGKETVLGKLSTIIYPPPDFYKWFIRGRLSLASSILDVGCGSGHLLFKLKKEGFKNLTGIDPHIDTSISFDSGLNIYKKTLDQVNGIFDFIMLNHSLEHMHNPLQIFTQIKRLLNHNGYAIIRTPVMGNFAWRTYGANWVQLDAPRHIFVHTPKSISLLAKRTGLDLTGIMYDSTGFQFWGSEQQQQNIPLLDERSVAVSKRKMIFSRKHLWKFDQLAKALNKQDDGDQACFFFREKQNIGEY